jgi:signal transduction histidine kinase
MSTGTGERRLDANGGTTQERGWLSQIPVPAAVLTSEGHVLRCNAEAAALLQRGPDAPAQVGAPGVPWLRRALRSAAENGRESVLLVRRFGGRRHAFELRCRRLAADEVLVLFTDCTRQFELHTATRTEDRRLRAFITCMREPVLIEQHGLIAFGNEEAAALLGRQQAAELHGIPLTRFFEPDVLERIRRVELERSEPDTIEATLQDATAPRSVRSVRIVPLPTAYRQEPAVQLLLLDLTAQHTTLESLRESEEQLRQAQKMESVGQLAAGIAHDFNNVLTAIQGHAQFLLDDLPPESQAHDDAAEIRRAAERATELTRQLLTFSRRQPSSPGLIDVNDVITGLEKLLRRLLRADMRLELVLQPDLPPIFADTGQIEQIVMNLVVNAREALRAAGVVTIRTARVQPGPHGTRDSTLPSGEYVQISVSDNGCGMSADVRRRIFEPFFTTKTEGTGLGLSTVLGFVTQLGGYISVHSEEDAGTTFRILLPADAGT